jgi:exonuclease III
MFRQLYWYSLHPKQRDYKHFKQKLHTIIPGYTIVLSINWHDNKLIQILNVYAPNNLNKHRDFWNTIQTELHRQNIESIDFMMGHFNLTENPMDCTSARLDNESAINALRDLRNTLNLQATWRLEHPHRHLFIFSSNHQILSRLDRIYPSERYSKSLTD